MLNPIGIIPSFAALLDQFVSVLNYRKNIQRGSRSMFNVS